MPAKPIRVLHVGKFYPPHRGGMETHLQLLCQGLSRSCNVSAIVSNEGPRTAFESDGAVRVTRAGTWCNVAGTSVSVGMASAIRASPADIIHLHWPNPTAVLSYLGSGHQGQLVITYHSDVVRQRLLARMFEPLLTTLLARAAAVIVASPRYIETSPVLQKVQGKCSVIPFGLRLEPYDDSASRKEAEEIRSRFGPRIILAVGRHVYYKGFEYLIAAMQRVEGTALIAGDGPLRQKLEELATNLGLKDRVVFLGEVDSVIPYYHAADVFVLPSIARSEAFGIVQLEAMACSCPVINTSLDSEVPFVSLDGVTGLTVAPKSAEELSGAINRLLDSPGLRARYGVAAKTRVETQFAASVMTRRTLDVYETILRSQEEVGSARSNAVLQRLS